jgi:hypothetical protein
MPGEHEAVAAVSDELRRIDDLSYPTVTEEPEYSEHRARAAIKAYQHHLATRSSDAVVQAVDELIVGCMNQRRRDSCGYDNAEKYRPHDPWYALYIAPPRTRLLALIAEHARGPVVVSSKPIIESINRDVDDYGNETIEHHVSVGDWRSYTSDGTLVLHWGEFKKNIWCSVDRESLADLITLYERQIELDEMDEAALVTPVAQEEDDGE